jgi:hypothetical protein
MRVLAAVATCVLVLAVVACGDDNDESGSDTGAATRLEVVVRAAGPDSPARRTEIECERLGPDASSSACRRLAGLTRTDLAPVRGTVACAQIYGGPAVATVDGTLEGEPVSARFKLTDSCEIERWRRNRALLGAVPSGR